jgi:sRNA-binding carbon storage regulator CsrA
MEPRKIGERRGDRPAALRKGKAGRKGATVARLVVSRKTGERVVIFADGKRIEVWVARVKARNTFAVAIEAPADCPIYREEIAPESEPAKAS